MARGSKTANTLQVTGLLDVQTFRDLGKKTIKEELGDWTMAEEVNRRFKAGCGDVEVETRTRQAIAGKIQKRSKKEGERLEAERAKPTLATNDSDLEFVNMET